MKKILECVPNFSEGRDQSKLDQIVAAITSISGVKLLGQEKDYAHNRAVVTFASAPEAVIEAAFQAIKKAAELIDLNQHQGVHPRMGATDVCPLIPLQGIDETEAKQYAEQLATRVGTELEIPVYLYEKSARRPERRNLANIRRGEYEGIKKEILTNPHLQPDFGPAKLGPAGCTAIGVRDILIAYNINLKTSDLSIAKKIAKIIREKDGGLKSVKALGLMLDDNRNLAQVSMNLVNFHDTNIKQVYDAIAAEAAKHDTEILESELIGFAPLAAFGGASPDYLKLPHFDPNRILENALSQNPQARTE